MPIDKIHPGYVDLKKRIRENAKQFVVIVGSGLSRPANIPDWKGLRDLLIKTHLIASRVFLKTSGLDIFLNYNASQTRTTFGRHSLNCIDCCLV